MNTGLNKKVKKYLDSYFRDTKTNSPEHQEAVMLVLRGALTDANFHSEAKQLGKYFPKASKTYVGTPMEDVIESKGEEIAKMAKWDGHEIIDAFAFYLSMSIGGSFGNRLMSLKESIEESLVEEGEKLDEKNVPTNPSKWSYYKAQAKKKFDVYPSAYANGWAAKQYKKAGGGWKSESVNEILVIVDKFDEKRQSYGKVYYKDGGKRPGDGDINKAKSELAKLRLNPKRKDLTIVSVGRNSKMYDVMGESVNEAYGEFIKAKNLTDIIKLSKQKKNAVFYVTDDNNSRIGSFYLKNGKFAKATTANANYDLQNNKTSLKDRGDVIYKYKIDESVNEVEYKDALADFNKELEKNSEVKKAAKHYKKSTKDVVQALQSKIKVNRYSDKSIKQISIDYKEDGPLSSKVSIKLSKDYKQNESVNEAASRTAMEIGGLTGMNKDTIQKFVDDNNLDIEKVYQFVKKGKLADRMKLVSAIAGKPNNPVQKKMVKQFGEDIIREAKVRLGKDSVNFKVMGDSKGLTLIAASGNDLDGLQDAIDNDVDVKGELRKTLEKQLKVPVEIDGGYDGAGFRFNIDFYSLAKKVK